MCRHHFWPGNRCCKVPIPTISEYLAFRSLTFGDAFLLLVEKQGRGQSHLHAYESAAALHLFFPPPLFIPPVFHARKRCVSNWDRSRPVPVQMHRFTPFPFPCLCVFSICDAPVVPQCLYSRSALLIHRSFFRSLLFSLSLSLVGPSTPTRSLPHILLWLP